MRLTTDLRERLRSLAKKQLLQHPDVAALNSTLQDRIAQLTEWYRSVIETKYPAADMAVLAKYGCTRPAKIHLRGSSLRYHDALISRIRALRVNVDTDIDITLEAPLLIPYGITGDSISWVFDTAATSGVVFDLLLGAFQASARLHQRVRELMEPFELLVTSSSTMAQVVRDWPEAAEVQAQEENRIRQRQPVMDASTAAKLNTIRGALQRATTPGSAPPEPPGA